jgi:hypothetical protein
MRHSLAILHKTLLRDTIVLIHQTSETTNTMPTYELDTHTLLRYLAQGDDAEAFSELCKFEERSGVRERSVSPVRTEKTSGQGIQRTDAQCASGCTGYRRDSVVSVTEKRVDGGR